MVLYFTRVNLLTNTGPMGPAGLAGSQVVVTTGDVKDGGIIPVPPVYTTDQCKVITGISSNMFDPTITNLTRDDSREDYYCTGIFASVLPNSDKTAFTVELFIINFMVKVEALAFTALLEFHLVQWDICWQP